MFDCLSLPGREGHHGSLRTLHCDWLSSLHGGRTLIGMWLIMTWARAIVPTQEEPFLCSSISVCLVSTLPSPAKKKTTQLHFFFFLCYFVFEINFLFSEEFYLWILFLRALLTLTSMKEIFKKKKHCKKDRKKTEWAQDQSFQNKN